jgi:hypothetical protein
MGGIGRSQWYPSGRDDNHRESQVRPRENPWGVKILESAETLSFLV